MSEESSQERTEEPTEKRKKDTREKGEIARSRDLNTTVILLAGSIGFLMFGDICVSQIRSITNLTFVINRDDIFNDAFLLRILSQCLQHALFSILPILVLIIIGTLAAPLLLGGFSFNPSAFSPKFERLNLLKGLQRIFALKGLIELVKSLLKFSVLALAAGILLWINFDKLLSLGNLPLRDGLVSSVKLLVWLVFGISSTLLAIVAIDVPYQIWEHLKKIRMTKQEIRDEYKESEGKPEVKRHIRRMQQEIARRRMMSDIPKADVVITNPTHYAVALRYDRDGSRAPVVVAKGQDLIAAQIRRIAAENNVVIVEVPPLARAIFFTTKLQHEIPRGLYMAVAQILAYVYQLRRHQTNKDIQPGKLPEVQIPDGYKF